MHGTSPDQWTPGQPHPSCVTAASYSNVSELLLIDAL